MKTVRERFLYYVENLFGNSNIVAAKALCCTQKGISRIRNGETPGGLLLLRLCENDRVNANWLLRGDVPQRPLARDFQSIADHIDLLYQEQARHVRRGYKITQTKPLVVSMHLLEEVAEFMEAVLIGKDPDAIVEEAGDVLAVYLHLLRHAQNKHPTARITLPVIIEECLDKLKRYWTSNPALVTAKKAGFTRRDRGAPPADCT